ncbi:TATA box-binding protein-associated factor RNA polymerase I subunit B isoform X1 [Tanacetum coccineum]
MGVDKLCKAHEVNTMFKLHQITRPRSRRELHQWRSSSLLRVFTDLLLSAFLLPDTCGNFNKDNFDTPVNRHTYHISGETKGVGPAAKHKSKPHNLLGKRSLMIWYHSVRKTTPLWYTLVISFLVCHLARESILSIDIIKWTFEGKLPYFAAFVEIGEQIGPPINTCPLSSSRMFGPIHAITVQKMESLTATMETRRVVE